jgi:hypothetical protein
LKKHHPHHWNKISFSFKEPPESRRPYYFIDRYFNHIRHPTNLAISQSTIPNAGSGLFAFLPNNLKQNGQQTIVFRKDDRIDEYKGDNIRIEIRIGNPNAWLSRTALQKVEAKPSEYYLLINKDYYVDAAPVDSCYGRYANDNKDVENGNNAIFEKEPHPTVALRDKCYLVALRDNKVDEEIFIGYGASYWEERDNPQQPKKENFKLFTIIKLYHLHHHLNQNKKEEEKNNVICPNQIPNILLKQENKKLKKYVSKWFRKWSCQT